MADSTCRDYEDETGSGREHGERREGTAGVEQPLPADQSRRVKSSQQFKYDLVNPPVDEAICPVCLDLAIKPFLVECCGQHLCQQCLTSVRAKGNLCPLCREVAPSAMHNKHFERNVILKQQVRCCEKNNGCQWVGQLGELQRHLTQCQFVEEDCPYNCGDGVQRHCLVEHKANLCPQRPFVCGHCDHCGTHREVTGQHWAQCEKFPLACPKECGADKVPRGQLQSHCDSECPLREVTCEFIHAGCKVRLLHQDLSQHMSDAAQQHMALVSRALLLDKEREIAELKQELRKKEQQHKEEMAKKDRQYKEVVESKDELHKKIEKSNKLHKEELAKKERQHKDELEKKDEEHKQELAKKDGQHKELVERMSRLEDMVSDHMRKTSRMQLLLGTYDYNFVCTNYQEKRMTRANWYSPPYYTHWHGYKMCVNLDMTFSDSNLHIYSYLLPGEYDDGLQWPFRGMVVVLLLNQLSGDDHHEYVFDYSRASNSQSQRVKGRERSSAKGPSGPHLPFTALEFDSSKKCQYYKDDCLKFRVVMN